MVDDFTAAAVESAMTRLLMENYTGDGCGRAVEADDLRAARAASYL